MNTGLSMFGKCVGGGGGVFVCVCVSGCLSVCLSVFLPVCLPPANEVWGKVIFLDLSVILFTGGMPGPGGAWSWGVPAPRGWLLRGGLQPPPGRLLLRTVRILLECILVVSVSVSAKESE